MKAKSPNTNGNPTPAESSGNLPDDEMLDSVASLIREFLVCDDYQLTVLTLWILNTWCFRAFPTTPYLHIHSPEPECGKSTCLQLLSLLSSRPWISNGPAPTALMHRLVSYEQELRKAAALLRTDSCSPEPPPKLPAPAPEVMLLDDYHHTFSSSERQPLLAMLSSGSTSDSRVLCSLAGGHTADLRFFGPKAFAGNGALPRSLASRCVPILLQRKRPSDHVRRFADGYARFAATPLVRWLDDWGDQHFDRLGDEIDPPAGVPDLTARQQDCTEPLLHIAAAIGGHWPEKAAIALSSIFDQAPTSDSLQLLGDIRSIFALCDNPSHLASKDLIRVLASVENRPWAGWTAKQGKLLARRLRPFKICSRSLRAQGSDAIFKGYRLCDFQDAWERYLPPIPPTVLRNVADRAFQPIATEHHVTVT